MTTNVNGTARNNNNTRLDGAQSVNIWLPHNAAYVAPSESVQEVNISTNNFDAEQGLAGGAAVQVITKSGTNEFHGSAFAYHDNHVFRARNSFQPLQLGTKQAEEPAHHPGATLGGPIIKDKLFFFGSWKACTSASSATASSPCRRRTSGRATFAPSARATRTARSPTTSSTRLRAILTGTGRTAFAGKSFPPPASNPSYGRHCWP